MKYGDIKYIDVLNGEGLRVSLFVSGCRNGCEGCFNKKLWDFSYGEEYTDKEERSILEKLNSSKINYSGISLLGGDPFEKEHIEALAELCKKVKSLNKTVWAWTGYEFEGLEKDIHKRKLLEQIDVLIDGKFILEDKDLRLNYRGSKNQRLIDVKKTLEFSKIVCIT